MDIYGQIAVKIISGQEVIIGPVAIEQAKQVKGMNIDWAKHEVTITGDKVETIEALIEKYQELFGQISVEVSRQSAASLLAKLPSGGQLKTLR
jgi:hypothetical protein